MNKTFFEILTSSGVSGDEGCISKTIKKSISSFGEAKIDSRGNLVVPVGKTDCENKILIDAHMDQIGFIVTKINENGFVKAEPVGGIDRRVIEGTTVLIIGTEPVQAVCCTMPPHLSSSDSAIKAGNIYFDTGLLAEKAKNVVSIGDRVVFADKPVALQNGRICSPALDNRASVFALLKAAEELYKYELKNTCVLFLFSAMEEFNSSGAKTAVYDEDVDEAIIVDTTFAQQQEVSESRYGKLGEGPMIGIAPTLSKDMSNSFKEIALDYKIPYQIEVMGSKTGTNTEEINTIKNGVRCALISIPIRNMHTQSEIVDIKDIDNTVKLLVEYIKNKDNCNAICEE